MAAEPNALMDRYYAGPVTATCVLLLVQRGLLDLDAPAARTVHRTRPRWGPKRRHSWARLQ